MILAHFSRSLRETFPARASEWALATIQFNWFVILASNPDLFASSAAHKALAQLMAQDSWGLLCMICGGGRLTILAINGAWRRSPHVRALGAFIGCFFWFQITVGLMQADTWGTGLTVYPVLLLLDSYNVLRAVGEAGLSDDHHKRRAAKDGHSG